MADGIKYTPGVWGGEVVPVQSEMRGYELPDPSTATEFCREPRTLTRNPFIHASFQNPNARSARRLA